MAFFLFFFHFLLLFVLFINFLGLVFTLAGGREHGFFFIFH
jgi:hypothetical protein